jgi:antitoxin MazE
MATQVAQKWGNSLAFRLPKSLAAQAGIEEGTPISLRVEGERIIISRAALAEPIDADELIARITPENRHEAVEFGAPVGNEVI